MLKSILITGAGGYMGKLVIESLVSQKDFIKKIVAHDIKSVSEKERQKDVVYVQGDIRSPNVTEIIRQHMIDTVVHLVSVVSPIGRSNPKLEYEIDVLGTENILKASVENKVQHFIITSSGAAYGYYEDNPDWLTENDAIRGNKIFPYAYHKKLIEEMLLSYRNQFPELKQLVLRPGTILGETTNNQITNLFNKRFLLGISGYEIPFVFVWDRDVADIIRKGIREEISGIYNIAGDGYCTMRQLAKKLNKLYICIPSKLLEIFLFVLNKTGLSLYDANQIVFLKYRPVLSNKKLKGEFGYIPTYNSEEVFDFFLHHNLFFKK
jgi:UDP-glucose 4-epimerase